MTMLPRPVYESLPFVYVGVGAISALGLDPTFGKLSGVTLIAAAWTIFSLRRAYRRTWQ